MAITIKKGTRAWEQGRFRIYWEAFDGEQKVNGNRASFNEEPDKATEAAAFANILNWVTAEYESAQADAAWKVKKEAYLTAQGITEDAKLIKKCVDDDLDLAAIGGVK